MKLTTGQFIALNAAFSAVLGAATQLGMATLQLLEIIPIFERVKPILTEPPEVTDDRRHPGELRGNVELYHLNFRYEKDGVALKNLDLKIRKGEFVALVGPSGSGKSPFASGTEALVGVALESRGRHPSIFPLRPAPYSRFTGCLLPIYSRKYSLLKQCPTPSPWINSTSSGIPKFLFWNPRCLMSCRPFFRSGHRT